jgi:hypothetical protein
MCGTALHCTELHCTLHSALHCTALHCTLYFTALHCTALHSALHCTSGQYMCGSMADLTSSRAPSGSRVLNALHCTALHSNALHCTALVPAAECLFEGRAGVDSLWAVSGFQSSSHTNTGQREVALRKRLLSFKHLCFCFCFKSCVYNISLSKFSA